MISISSPLIIVLLSPLGKSFNTFFKIGESQSSSKLSSTSRVIPEYSTRIKDNYNFFTAYALGCQFMCMNYSQPTVFMQTYIGKFVPVVIHGRIFALLGVLKDGLAIPQLIAISILADFIGVENVLTFAPIAILLIASALLFTTRQNQYGRYNQI